MKNEYNPQKIEKKWQQVWDKKKIYAAKDFDTRHKKFFGLIEFPFPSGEGLHVGHIRSYTAMDVIARKKRMEGHNVLFPIGWDAFGLPSEQFAIKTGIHPSIITQKNTKNFERQMRSIGFSFDWDRKVDTSSPQYYRWTQWMFLQFFKYGVAYQKETEVWWCEALGTVLANEEVIDGKSERGNFPCVRRPLPQWMVAITKYAEQLYNDLDDVNYPDQIKNQIRNWIGKSEGAEIEFDLLSAGKKTGKKIKVFTTRPDTLFGVTYVVLAPEHEYIDAYKNEIENWKEIESYKQKTKSKSDLERSGTDKTKSGAPLKGLTAKNPINGEEVPVWTADYVLASYGTGAVMAVPAHDERDAEFAEKFELPIKDVVFARRIDDKQPPREGKKNVARDMVIALVENPEGTKLIGLQWLKFDWRTPVNGGIEKGESLEKASLREITEETGYTDVEFVKELGQPYQAEYFAAHKDENRVGTIHIAFCRLKSEAKKEISEEEKKTHKLVWVDKKDFVKFFTYPDYPIIKQRYLLNNFTFTDAGILKNSGKFDGKNSNEAVKDMVKAAGGKMVTRYKLRDWVFSRQRYWGEPFPIVWVSKEAYDMAISFPKGAVKQELPKEPVTRIRVINIKTGETVTEYALPVPSFYLPLELPKVKSFAPAGDGKSALGTATAWVNIYMNVRSGETIPEKKYKSLKNKKEWFPGMRETDTMPNWAGSSWYYLRYADPHNVKMFADKKHLHYWTPVDWYNGGMEHNTLHVLYSRFWHKFLHEIGMVPTKEPYTKRTSHGVILASDGQKMSKSVGNVVNPDDVIKQFGADTLRAYEMFIGPFEQMIAWNPESITGVRRFIEKFWKLAPMVDKKAPITKEVEVLMHQTIKKVTEDIESMSFNTAISSLMIYTNALEKEVQLGNKINQDAYQTLLLLVAPFAPHAAEELWSGLKHKTSIHQEMWPTFDPKKVVLAEVKMVIQINGKVRAEMMVERGSSDEAITKQALALPAVIEKLAGATIKKTIVVKDRLVSFVI